MSDKLVRDEILESDRWLDLPSDTDRTAFFIFLLRVDDFGNIEAGFRKVFRMLSLATDAKTDEQVQSVLQHLLDADLLRRYTHPEHEGREFLHLPRLRPTRQYLVRKVPPSPWDQDLPLGKHVRKQSLAKNVADTSQKRSKKVSKRSSDISLGVGVGVGEILKPARAKATTKGHRPATRPEKPETVLKSNKPNGNGENREAEKPPPLPRKGNTHGIDELGRWLANRGVITYPPQKCRAADDYDAALDYVENGLKAYWAGKAQQHKGGTQ